MKKILLYIPDPQDGVSRMRCWGPLSMIRDNFQFTSFPNDDSQITHWTWYYNYDLALMSRPHRLQHQAFVEMAERSGLKIWIDMDDALFHIPVFNDSYRVLGRDNAQKILRYCLERADVISVSSKLQGEWLKKNLKLKGHVVLIPNALDDRLLHFKRDFQKSKKIAWRGSKSHGEDLLRYSRPIQEFMVKKEDYDFGYFGYVPYCVGTKNMRVTEECNFLDYYGALSNYHPMLTHVPLVDSFFNRVKSHLGWLDATLCGSLTLGPNWEEWQIPGIYHYTDQNSYLSQLEQIIGKSEAELKKNYQESWEYIDSELMLSKINELRINLMNGDYF